MVSLTARESQVMKCLWDTGRELTCLEIMDIANEKYGCGWRPTTVSTYLSHLVNKDFLKMKRSGKTFTYDILIPEEEYLQYEMKKMADFWAGGTSRKLIAALGRENRITREDAEKIRELLDVLGE